MIIDIFTKYRLNLSKDLNFLDFNKAFLIYLTHISVKPGEKLNLLSKVLKTVWRVKEAIEFYLKSMR